MIAVRAGVGDTARRSVRAWQRFWFRTEPAYTVGLVRIAFGLLMTAWTLSLYPSLDDLFGPAGVVPRSPTPDFTWSLFRLLPDDRAVLIGWIVLLAASLALTVGWHSRLAAILVFVLLVSFERRNPFVMNAGDVLLRIEALFIALAPSGAALSLDQRRRAGSFWNAEVRPLWAIRLMQIQVSVIYVSTVVAKLHGETWQDGTAVAYSLRQRDLLFFTTPTWITDTLVISNVLSWGTLVIELAIGLMVWNRRWRPWVLAGGVVLHLCIFVSMAIGLFSLAVFVLYVAFIPSERSKAIADGVAARLHRHRRPAEPVKAAAPQAPTGAGRHAKPEPQPEGATRV
ncbi:HTTM domain-containing protein [Mycolicibacterium litorale]|uniref:HTTM-like domain-containing protein n=1 Tax=Mycolicibacterium litorale TaxID=758802 RepID=A0AAD1IME6_9MYCO|nr:HTTM domain-containing protein [Mycolicibacterium litorale]MCV7416794.1 HTTM domain-containing protein [Mycolicibacterium litorale]TDY04579.1 vitamin K-dependent gamma-carboxylase-like protein [Mycolicibacterium litorale]BBY18005.1 hypothetical protein MLIT_35970 [Mycolicibacterium litorale]